MFLPLFGGGFEANAFVFSAGKSAVVDAGGDPIRVLETLKEYSIKPSFFINTHCHFDHIGSLPELLDEFPDAVVVMHELDAAAVRDHLDDRILARLFGRMVPLFDVDLVVSGGEVIDLDGIGLQVLHTPGHTPGGISLFERDSKMLLTGDVVFSEGVGRTDFAGGDADALKSSLEFLVGFCSENGVKRIFPGHGQDADPEAIKRALQFYFP